MRIGLIATAVVLLTPLGWSAAGSEASASASAVGGWTQTTVTRDSYDRAPVNSPELSRYLASLGPSDRADFERSALPATVVETNTLTAVDVAARQSASASLDSGMTSAASKSGCWRAKAQYDILNGIGGLLYRFYHVGGWCASGGKVTSASTKDYGGQTFFPGWRYSGRLGGASGVVSNTGRSYTQFKFVFGVGGWDVDHRYDCARTRGTANATALGDRTCGIY